MKKIKGSDFNFESVELMDYKIHKVWLKRGVSYTESPEWILYKRATINPKNEKDNKFFQYSSTLALNYNEIKKRVRKHLKKLNMKIQIFRHAKETGKILNKTISQSLLMSYLHHKTVQK